MRLSWLFVTAALAACSGTKSSGDAGPASISGGGGGSTGAGASGGSSTGCGQSCATSTGSSASSGSTTGGQETTGGSGSGSTSATSAGSTGGGASSTGAAGSTGGSTGGGCAAIGASCQHGDCCGGGVCDLGSGTCLAAACGPLGTPCGSASDCCAGLSCQNLICSPPCAAAGASCLSVGCCFGLLCEVTGPASASCRAPPDGGCLPSALGGPCVTMADCQRGLVCQMGGDGGPICGSPLLPSAACVPNAQACTPGGSPCCGGDCVAGLCLPRGACAFAGGSCGRDADCCSELGCDAGSCQPACGAASSPCDPANGNADCCAVDGLSCLAVGSDGGSGRCGFARYAGPSGPFYCGGPCSGFPCAPGTTCQPPAAAGAVDPCAGAGLVCDPGQSVCRQPGEFEACEPGGPGCRPIAGSSAEDLRCLPIPAEFGSSGDVCLQPCSPADPGNGSSDCVDPLMICSALSSGGGHACSYDLALGSCPGGSPYFGACNSFGTNDGFCLPFNFPGGSEGVCMQSTLDGGAPGDPCLVGGNRQNGGLCGPSSLCVGGLCEAACNAGTNPLPACAGPDGGAALACIPTEGQTGDSSDMGNCSVLCDFTDPAGGGCTGTGPEKCVPELLFTGLDSAAGVCVAAAPAPAAVGQPCGTVPGLVDGCAAGALCLAGSLQGGDVCAQLCTAIGSVGAAPCGAGSTCQPLAGGGATSTQVGYCAFPDGGL